MIRNLLELVKIEHTLFALPLALSGAILAQRGIPSVRTIMLVALAFTGARTMAMAFNRLADREIDIHNPRTADREIPTGKVSLAQAWGLVLVSASIFMLAAWGLNDLCFYLAPIALAGLLAYSYTKRFTWLCHIFLGLCLGMAPLAGWLAVSGKWSWTPIVLSLGIVFWVTGFDIIYACQDVDFDRDAGLHSIPARFNPRHALSLAAIAHLIAFGLFILVGYMASLSLPFYLMSTITAGLLIWEHRLVNPTDLSRIDLAFFKVNSMVSLSLLLAISFGLT